MASKILVVDDEPDLVEILSFELRAQGHTVVSAGNGKEALVQIKKEKPNLIISDINMPEMDGVDFFTSLKKDKNTKDIPIFILTASGNLEKYFRVLKVEDFMSKPFEMDALHAKVKQLLEAPKPRNSTKIESLIEIDDSSVSPAIAPAVKAATAQTDEEELEFVKPARVAAEPAEQIRQRKRRERFEDMLLMMKIVALCVFITVLILYFVKTSNVLDLFLPKDK